MGRPHPRTRKIRNMGSLRGRHKDCLWGSRHEGSSEKKNQSHDTNGNSQRVLDQVPKRHECPKMGQPSTIRRILRRTKPQDKKRISKHPRQANGYKRVCTIVCKTRQRNASRSKQEHEIQQTIYRKVTSNPGMGTKDNMESTNHDNTRTPTTGSNGFRRRTTKEIRATERGRESKKTQAELMPILRKTRTRGNELPHLRKK